MLTLKQAKSYCAPEATVILIAPAEILCSSPGAFGGSTEDMGNLEDIFGAN